VSISPPIRAQLQQLPAEPDAALHVSILSFLSVVLFFTHLKNNNSWVRRHHVAYVPIVVVVHYVVAVAAVVSRNIVHYHVNYYTGVPHMLRYVVANVITYYRMLRH
jgi:ABC-type xylose transport system permease subunit